MKMSLGTWRFFLAFLVVLSHLWTGMIDGPAAYAVWGFFVLSGYLMTWVLTTRYGTETYGIRQFARNRLLRIYPSFIASSIFGIITIIVLSRMTIDLTNLNPQFKLPQGGREWVSNLVMFPFVSQQGLPVPVAAALFVEVWAYALMPLFAKSNVASVLGLAMAVCANLQFGFGMPTFIDRYCGFATGLMPFAFGAVICHYRANLRRFANPIPSITAWCVHGLFWLADPYWPWTYGLWVSVPLSAWVVLSLAEIKVSSADKVAGELSYPIYLLHTAIAAWFVPYFGFARGFMFFMVSFAATLLASWGMLRLIDRPMQSFRRPMGYQPVNGPVVRCQTQLRSCKSGNAGPQPYEIHTGRKAVTSATTKMI